MRLRVVLSLGLLLAAALVGAVLIYRAHKSAAIEPLLPANQAFEALIGDYTKEQEKLRQTYQTASTAEEKRVVRETLLPELEASFAERFLDFARRYPEEEQAVNAIVWLCTRSDLGPQTDQIQDEAIDLYVQHHIQSRTLSESIRRLAAADSGKSGEKLLRVIQEKSPHRRVQAMACLGLAEHTRAKAEAAYYQKRPDAEQLNQEAEKLYQQIADGYRDVIFEGSSLAAVANANLVELRTLGLGKPAPESEGEDIDGKSFKLSDYRGKVVLLSFWGFWCPPCRKMFPHERALVTQYANKPFALLGVNTDSERDEARRLVKEEDITWRSWWNGGQSGAISRRWNVSSLPSFFLLDAKGVIRYKGDVIRSPEGLHMAVETLLKELEKETKAKSKNNKH